MFSLSFIGFIEKLFTFSFWIGLAASIPMLISVYLKKRAVKKSVKDSKTEEVENIQRSQEAEQKWNEEGKEVDKIRDSS